MEAESSNKSFVLSRDKTMENVQHTCLLGNIPSSQILKISIIINIIIIDFFVCMYN